MPATFEVLAVVLFAPMILGVTRVEAAVMGRGAAYRAGACHPFGRRVPRVAGTKLTKKERLFCVIAYLPKATGAGRRSAATPLAMACPGGNLVLSVAVLAILLTAPLGAMRHGRNGRQTAQK